MTASGKRDDREVEHGLDALRTDQFGADCLSEAALDAYLGEELAASASVQIRDHLGSCGSCQRRVERRRGLFDAIGAQERKMMVERIVSGIAASELSGAGAVPERPRVAGRRPWLRRLRPWTSWRGVVVLPMAAVAAAAAVVFLMPLIEPAGTGERTGLPVTLSKGGRLRLQVFRKEHGGGNEVLAGARLAAGDQLRFQVRLDRPGHIMVVGVEQSGSVYPCFPLRNQELTDVTGKTEGSVKISTAGTHVLPGAVQLDASRGRESLFVIWCPTAFRLETLQYDKVAGRLEIPASCGSDAFRFEKVP